MIVKYYFLLNLLVACLFCFEIHAQERKLSYTKSMEDFPNPERGFYHASGEKPGKLLVEELKKLRTVYSVKSPHANYSTWISLIYRGYLLTDFRNDSISPAFLASLQKDFDAVREAGLKVVLRFSYIDRTRKGNCPDKEICPPYGDAPKNIVLQHIGQLKPLFKKNADVIAVLQQGFIGIWGENHYTDYFGDASGNDLGFVPDSSWNDRNDVLKSLLDALPKDRMVQVRTPQMRQRFLYGARAPITTKPSAATAPFDHSDHSRVAFHNDCFLASKDDYGTFSDYGNSTKVRMEGNTVLRRYFIEESKYLAVGGETCDDSFSPQNDCAPLGHAIKAMADMHYSFLNVNYNNLVNNDWETQGCMLEIKRNLGYRFILQESTISESAKAGDTLSLKLRLQNEGFATPYNPRPVKLVLRNKATGNTHQLAINTNIQKWYTGQVHLTDQIALPKNLQRGNYELLLNIPDGYQSLQNRPEYSIRLANEHLWEENTGFNKLNQVLKVL